MNSYENDENVIKYHMALASMERKRSANAVETRWQRVKRDRGDLRKMENLKTSRVIYLGRP